MSRISPFKDGANVNMYPTTFKDKSAFIKNFCQCQKIWHHSDNNTLKFVANNI